MEYKKHEIRLNEKTGDFELYIKEVRVCVNSTLKGIKSYIDRKVKKGFKQFTAIASNRGWRRGYRIVTITSMFDFWAWTVDREKMNTSYLYKDIPGNRELMGQINILEEEKEKIEEKVGKLEKKFVYVKEEK